MRDYLDFEKPLQELELRLAKLAGAGPSRSSTEDEVRQLQTQLSEREQDLFANLSPWQRTQLARHVQRPTALEYIESLCGDFLELHGDRCFGDDKAVVGGFGRIGGRSLMVLGTQKGKTLKERVRRNFGMPNPEGYRKVLRLIKMAEKFHTPIVTFIDTPGAYPGIGAEERGQAEAIARTIQALARLQVPIIAVIIGEGGSGGALALGVADRVLMFEHAIYSVISPEGCAAILWDDPRKAPEAASALRMTAKDLLELKVIDEIIPEPLGGAHRDPQDMALRLGKSLTAHLSSLSQWQESNPETLVSARETKFRNMGAIANR